MMSIRTNSSHRSAADTADACFAAMQRHNNGKATLPTSPPPKAPPPPGDILYGGRAIASYLFPDEDPNKARRRIFHLWSHYQKRKEDAGFFKIKGALCLSKSKWLAFHGLV